MIRRVSCAILLLVLSGLALAGGKLLGRDELVFMQRLNPACCVIDARAATARGGRPLKEAIAYHPDLAIQPSATVVVVADSDRAALQVVAALERKHPGKAVVAVKGGAPTWQAVLTRLAELSEGESVQFVIPHNTCETGNPLQTLQSKPK